MSTQRDSEVLLRTWLDANVPAAAPADLLQSALASTGRVRSRPAWLASVIGEALPDSRRTTRRQLVAFAVAAAVVAVLAVVGIQVANFTRVGSGDPTLAPTAGPIDWRGSVPRVAGEAAMIPLLPFRDGSPALTDRPDVSVPWVDITDVSTRGGQTQWHLLLKALPPEASGLDPDETLIAYGLVFETTGDEVADFVVGISNAAPQSSDFRVWVTNLTTGTTSEQIGPPYGFPIEFSHPDEGQPATDPPSTRMMFTFLGGSRPSGLGILPRFYAWASLTNGSEVVAWDYEPDLGWPDAER